MGAHILPEQLCVREPHTSSRDISQPARKAVVVHAGARDAYQLALSLSQYDMLDALVTDLFWPAESSWTARLARLSPGLHGQALQRSAEGLPFARIRLCPWRGLSTLLVEKVRRTPAKLRRLVHRSADAALGRTAGELAARHGSGLVTYSYYGFHAMQAYGRPTLLFQVHPHAATMRRILQQELADHPDCAESLCQEWELTLPEQDFEHLVQESAMASRYLVASTFTKNSLIEHGADPQSISVVSYGVDLQHFHPSPDRKPIGEDAPLRLLFVGRINQRKGVKYLLEALRLLPQRNVSLTICGRVVDSLSLFRNSGIEVNIRPSVSSEELVAAYQNADLFVFPSVAEGFAQVLLESLACGLPILSTTHTAAPDLITEGKEGFIVEPRRPDLLAERIGWCVAHRRELEEMRLEARRTAEQFTWERFRSKVAVVVGSYLEQDLR